MQVAAGSTTTTRYFAFAGATIAMRQSGQLTWLASDGQNSRQFSISAVSGLATRTYYTPYGAQRAGAATLPTDQSFLGRVVDSNTGLVQDGARYYDPSLGQFVSPDPLGDASNNQGLDPYAYANDNPSAFTDATGLRPACDSGDDCRAMTSNWQHSQARGVAQQEAQDAAIQQAHDDARRQADVALQVGANAFYGVGLTDYAGQWFEQRMIDVGARMELGLAVTPTELQYYKAYESATGIVNVDGDLQSIIVPNVGSLEAEVGERVLVRAGEEAATKSLSHLLADYATALPADVLARQSTMKDVYLGVSDEGTNVYVGISVDSERRFAQHIADGKPFADFLRLGRLPEYQARAVEQAAMDANPDFLNQIASIAASRSFGDEARVYGQAWLAQNQPWVLG